MEDDITNRVVEVEKTDNPPTSVQRTRIGILTAYSKLVNLRRISFLRIKILISAAGYISLIQLLTA